MAKRVLLAAYIVLVAVFSVESRESNSRTTDHDFSNADSSPFYLKPNGKAVLNVVENVLRRTIAKNFKVPAKRSNPLEADSEDMYNNNNNIMLRWKKYENNLNVLRTGFMRDTNDFFDIRDIDKERLKILKNQVLNMKLVELNNRLG